MSLRRDFVVLDGLRGVAALSIVLFHFHQAAPGLLGGAYLAVDLFFLLSGFVITHAYERRLLEGMSFTAFLRARVIRLWPLLALGCALGIGPFLMKAHTHQRLWLAASIAPNFLLIPSPPGASPERYLFPVDIPAWTLVFEILANLAYAAVVKRLTTRVLVTVCVGLAVLSAGFAGYRGSLGGGDNWNTLFDGFLRVSMSYSAGVLLYRLRPWTWRTPPQLQALISVALMVIMVAGFQLGGWIHPKWAFELLFVLAFSPLIVSAGSALVVTGRLGAFYGALGFASYALYALHDPLASYVTAFGRAAGIVSSVTDPRLICMKVVVVVAAAFLAAYAYDAPLRRWLTERLAGAGGPGQLIAADPAASALRAAPTVEESVEKV